MTPSAKILELEERVYRLTQTLEVIVARARNWGEFPAASEYYKAGMKAAYADLAYLATAGIRWAEGDAEDGPG
jgi:hypothetical protein